MKLYTDGTRVVRGPHKARAFDLLQEIYGHPNIAEIEEIPQYVLDMAGETGLTLDELEEALESHAAYAGISVGEVCKQIQKVLESLGGFNVE